MGYQEARTNEQQINKHLLLNDLPYAQKHYQELENSSQTQQNIQNLPMKHVLLIVSNLFQNHCILFIKKIIFLNFIYQYILLAIKNDALKPKQIIHLIVSFCLAIKIKNQLKFLPSITSQQRQIEQAWSWMSPLQIINRQKISLITQLLKIRVMSLEQYIRIRGINFKDWSIRSSQESTRLDTMSIIY
ncbi:unnamed protein product [Paramecium sonneborni]|uniref:Uncharacterized protein n=1 Tax=Paramecium sonneborni TaxID=65129 RepID=A0A8S1RRL9_9CILI|nr:unnamed protein product [Paramecium sonneborni]